MYIFKALLGLILIFALLLPVHMSAFVQAQDGTTVTATTRSDLNVRTEPNANAALAGVLPANTTVEVLEQFTNTAGELWLRIPYEDGEGWIAGWLVTINEGIETIPGVDQWLFEAENGLSAGFKGRITYITIAPADWQTHLDQYEIAAKNYAVATATIAFPNGQTLDVVVLIYNDNLQKTLIIGNQDLTSAFIAFANTEEALAENGIIPGAEVIIDLGQLTPDANFADWLNELAVESDVALSMVETGDLSAIQDRGFIVPVGVSVIETAQVAGQGDTETTTVAGTAPIDGEFRLVEVLDGRPDSRGFYGTIESVNVWDSWRDEVGIDAALVPGDEQGDFCIATITVRFANGQVLDNVCARVFNATSMLNFTPGGMAPMQNGLFATGDALRQRLAIDAQIVPGAQVLVVFGVTPTTASGQPVANADWRNSIAVDPSLVIQMAEDGDLSPLGRFRFAVPSAIIIVPESSFPMEHSEQGEITWVRPVVEWTGMYYVDCTVISLDASPGRKIDPNRSLLVSATCETPNGQSLDLALGVRINGTAVVGRAIFENSRMSAAAANAFLGDQGIGVGTNITLTIGNIPGSATTREANILRPICAIDQASVNAFAESGDIDDLGSNLTYGEQEYIIPAGVNLR